MFPAVNMPCGWCRRTYGYVSTHMPPTRRRRSIRMTFWSRERYWLATNSALSPARPAPTMQTSHVSTSADCSTGTGCNPGIIGAAFRRSTPRQRCGAGPRLCVGAATTHRVIDYSTFLTGHTYVTDGRQPDESDKVMTKAKSGEKDG